MGPRIRLEPILGRRSEVSSRRSAVMPTPNEWIRPRIEKAASSAIGSDLLFFKYGLKEPGGEFEERETSRKSSLSQIGNLGNEEFSYDDYGFVHRLSTTDR